MQLNEIEDYQLLGVPKRKEKTYQLRAGKLQACFCSGRLMDVTYNGRIVLLEVYFALRDQNWNTIPYSIKELELKDSNDCFVIKFHAAHEQGTIQYNWDGMITGNRDSTITYEFKGKATSQFLRNRIGFCLLHPADLKGEICRIVHTRGNTEFRCFPEYIAPYQPFLDIKKMEYDIEKGVSARIEFEGEIFETEDQRNWTDASFKTYCTPLSLPFPIEVKSGECASQKIKISLGHSENILSAERAKKRNGKSFRLGSVIKVPLTEREMYLVEQLHLTHLRYDYYFTGENKYFENIVCQATKLKVKIKLALFFTEEWQKESDILVDLLEQYSDVIYTILVFAQGVKVVSPQFLETVTMKVKKRCPDLLIGSGTDAFFTQNNREPLPVGLMDIVSYSNNPQVHAFDNDSIMSATDGQTANVYSCKKLFPGIPISVSPVTLKMRWNPDLTGEEICKPGTIPKQVDERQMSLFAGAWFIRSLCSLVCAGADEAEYFELTGSAGIIRGNAELDYPFPAVPEMLFPLYYAMYFAAPLAYSAVSGMIEKEYAALIIERDGHTRVLVANSCDFEITVRFAQIPANAKSFGLNLSNIKPYLLNSTGVLSGQAFKDAKDFKTMKLSAYEIRVLDF